MKKTLVLFTLVHGLCLLGHACAQFASAVVDYTPGNLLGYSAYNNPTSALGQPGAFVSYAQYGYPDQVFSPFDPHYETSAMVGIGASGGQLTLQLQNSVNVQSGAYEIGVWSDIGLNDSTGNGTNYNPASTLNLLGSAVVSVSADGTNWFTINGGNPIAFSNPGNYYTNAGPYDTSAPATPQYANFGQPFTGSLADFNGEDYSQVLTTLNGSAGGTWLDLDGTGLSEVDYIRFNDVPDGEVLMINGVGINTALPEPATAGLLGLGAILALGARRRRKPHQPDDHSAGAK
jgi:hypothetical protein